MAGDHEKFAHTKYAKRLAEIEKREQERQQKHQRQYQPVHHAHHQPKPIGSKLPKLKRQRVSRTVIRAGVLFLFFGVIFGVMLFIASPLSRVDHIEVKGNAQLTDHQVLSAASVKRGDFMWQIDNRSAKVTRTATKANPEIKQINIKTTGFRSVVLTVKENRVIGSVYRGGRYAPVLSSGYVMAHTQTTPVTSGAVYTGFKSQKMLVTTAKQYAGLSKAVQSGISEIKFQPTKNDSQRLRLFMNDGNEVLIKYSELKSKMDYYPGIANAMKNNGVVNLEVGAYSHGYSTKK